MRLEDATHDRLEVDRPALERGDSLRVTRHKAHQPARVRCATERAELRVDCGCYGVIGHRCFGGARQIIEDGALRNIAQRREG